MASSETIRVPDIGDFEDVDVIEVLVSAGDEVQPEDPLITLESDKASMDVPAPKAGRVTKVHVKVGDQVSEGDPVVDLEPAGEAGDEEPAGESAEKPAEESAEEPAEESAEEPAEEPAEREEGEKGKARREEGAEEEAEEEQGAEEEAEEEQGAEEEAEEQEGAEEEAEEEQGAEEEAEEEQGAEEEAEEEQGAEEEAEEEQGAERPAERKKTGKKKADETVDEEAFRQAHASPAVRKLARELGADLGRVEGSGRKGRITERDLKQYVKRRLTSTDEGEAGAGAAGAEGLPAVPEVDFSKFGPVETEPLSKINRVGARHVRRAWLNVPHVTQHDEADVTELLAFRAQHKKKAEDEGYKLTPLAFVVQAAVRVLQEMPRFRSSLAPGGRELVLKRYYHIGIAVDTPHGLIMPVLRDADQLGILETARQLAALAERTRERKIKPEDLEGASFSISNLGGIGGTAFTPIVSAPEVAMLGLSRTQVRPRYTGESFEPRQVLPLSLSYDHRVIDGAAAARFTTRLGEILGDLRQLLL
jgi:pyruvate dehydrogenase E2 component (dihydrolipoamide acetyltransferase)